MNRNEIIDDLLDSDEYSEGDLFQIINAEINEPYKSAIRTDAIDELAQLLDGKSRLMSNKNMNALLAEAIRFDKYKTFLFLKETFFDSGNFRSKPVLILALLVNGSDAFIINLINTSDDVNPRDKTLKIPLHVSMQKERLKVAEYLIAKGANVDAKDCEGFTPLHYAVQASNKDAVCMLLYYEAKPEEVSIYTKETPFMTSLCVKNHEIQELLLDYVVDFNRKHVYGQNLLYLALKHRSPFCEEIIKRGATIGENINILFTDIHMFSMMWPMIDRTVLSWQRFPLLKNLLGRRMSKKEILYYLEVLLSSKHVDILIEQYENAPSEFQVSLFADVCETLQKYRVELSQRLGILYLLLSLGAPVYKNDLNRIITCFGYNEEFEAMMIVNPDIIADNLFQSPSPLFECVCFNRMRMPNHCEFKKVLELKNLLIFYVPDQKFKDEFYEKYAQIYGHRRHKIYKQLLQSFEKQNVPSLLQLSRDCVREIIYSKNRGKTKILSFYSEIKALPVPRVIEDILLLKKPLYKL